MNCFADGKLLCNPDGMSQYFIDPPMGWQFGFPKVYSGHLDKLDWNSWLLQNGYPAELIKDYPGGLYCRIIGPIGKDSEAQLQFGED